jgi:type VI secretion system Hcp family effector
MALAASRKSLPVVLVLALAFVVVLPTASWAALNAYLKLPDCDGTVAAGGLTGLIRLEGFTSKFANIIASSPGGGGAVGKAQASPIQVLKDLDKCSPQIFVDVVTGKHLQTVTILFTHATKGGKEQAFFRLTLTDAFITAIENTTVAKAGTEELRNIQDSTAAELNTGNPTAVQEIVTLSFGKITLTDLVTNTTATFDFSQNKL